MQQVKTGGEEERSAKDLAADNAKLKLHQSTETFKHTQEMYDKGNFQYVARGKVMFSRVCVILFTRGGSGGSKRIMQFSGKIGQIIGWHPRWG